MLLAKNNDWNLFHKNNIEVEIEKRYEELILVVSKHTTEDLNKITTFRFYMLYKMIKQEHSK